MSLVSCDQKQISNKIDIKTQSFAIKIVNLTLPHTADFLTKDKIACHNDNNLLCALGLRLYDDNSNLHWAPVMQEKGCSGFCKAFIGFFFYFLASLNKAFPEKQFCKLSFETQPANVC